MPGAILDIWARAPGGSLPDAWPLHGAGAPPLRLLPDLSSRPPPRHRPRGPPGRVRAPGPAAAFTLHADRPAPAHRGRSVGGGQPWRLRHGTPRRPPVTDQPGLRRGPAPPRLVAAGPVRRG